MIRVIGVGSPFGDDAAGIEAARQLAAAPPPGAEVLAADRPGTSLVDLLDTGGAVILVDAVYSGAPPGTLHDFDLNALPARWETPLSSHEIGVAAAVRLLRALRGAPLRGRFLGIEGAESTASGAGRHPGGATLSAATGAAVGRAVARARRWCAVYARRVPTGGG